MDCIEVNISFTVQYRYLMTCFNTDANKLILQLILVSIMYWFRFHDFISEDLGLIILYSVTHWVQRLIWFHVQRSLSLQCSHNVKHHNTNSAWWTEPNFFYLFILLTEWFILQKVIFTLGRRLFFLNDNWHKVDYIISTM